MLLNAFSVMSFVKINATKHAVLIRVVNENQASVDVVLFCFTIIISVFIIITARNNRYGN